MQKAKAPLLFIFLALAGILHSQNLVERLSGIGGITFRQIPNNYFKEYYEIFIGQALDHNNPSSAKFRQRIILGFNSFDSVTVMDTDGYGIEYCLGKNYEHELASLLHGNLVKIEHRFFGKSMPDSLDYRFLTTKQAAEDDHSIRVLFATLFQKKWISTGISKGGQAALAYKIAYPADVSFTVLYGAAVKKALKENKVDSMLNSLSQTDCGKKIDQFRDKLLAHKTELIHDLDMYAKKNELKYGMETETVFDYMLLEFPFSFWQTGCNCNDVHFALNDHIPLFEFFVTVISPSFYSEKSLKRLEPAFYMNYSELGYYEYDKDKFRPYLKQRDYSNKNFAPKNTTINFSASYLNALNAFLKTKEAESLVFIYGEHDPWSSMQDTGKAKKIIIKSGSHKSRIVDMSVEQRNMLLHYLR